MTARPPAWRFWAASAVIAAGGIYLLRDVLTPFAAGLAIAYLLDPAVRRVQRWGGSRLVATVSVAGLFFIALLVAIALLAPVLYGQASGFFQRLPSYLEAIRERLAPLVATVEGYLSPEDISRLRAATGGYAGEALKWFGTALAGLWSGGMALVNVLSLLFITPLVAFYLLNDWPGIVARVDRWLPRDQAPIIRAQLKAIDRTLAGFLRGQSTVCATLGLFYGVGLALTGLEFGFVLGIATGLLSFVPIFGMLTGLLVTLLLAAVQFGTVTNLAIIAAVFALGQMLESNVLTPRLVGDRIGLHPVWVIFALMAGGALFGFLGLLLAVPVTAVIGVLCRFALDRYLAGPIYRGGAGRSGA